MTELQDNSGKRWREEYEQFAHEMRGKRSPKEFILAQKTELTNTLPDGEGEVAFGDVIAMLDAYQTSGVIKEEDIRQVVTALGQQFGLDALTPEQYFGEFVPQVQQQMAALEAAERLAAEQRAREEAASYVEHWGIQRLDNIAQYYEDHKGALEGVAQANWESRLERYKRERERIAEDLPTMQDVFAQRDALTRVNFLLTGLHPQESERIHATERTLGKFVYVDRLFDLSRSALYPFSIGRSPDDMDTHYSSGGIGVSVRAYTFDNPASMMAAKREGAFSYLAFGASSPAESHSLGKRLILPYQLVTARR